MSFNERFEPTEPRIRRLVRASPIWKHSSARLLNDTRVRGVQAHHCQYYANPQSGRPAPKSIDCCLSGSFASPQGARRAQILKPETVLRWHRAGFRAYWRWKSRSCGGRPKAPVDIRQLIREMSVANPLWEAPRIHGELLKLASTSARRPSKIHSKEKSGHRRKAGRPLFAIMPMVSRR